LEKAILDPLASPTSQSIAIPESDVELAAEWEHGDKFPQVGCRILRQRKSGRADSLRHVSIPTETNSNMADICPKDTQW